MQYVTSKVKLWIQTKRFNKLILTYVAVILHFSHPDSAGSATNHLDQK